ncbi:ATP-binding protein [Chryseobacterium sp. SSA4.19]|uniref:AAA family ATPase n=1 Tax=Chryseobacterium sp. SSA4.19 TaxID=2919915 RepID=UPI001F4D5D47|nr:AAA family ATPase [Chryseobacterium sp. SSA4.19]MCJ8155745.1 ATP-binding protein [Chryseobacterium sp. SSA4.19]
MRKSNLKSFTIKGLFGNRNISIPFKEDVKILIGENGLGKTTALNMLYYTLTSKFFKLKDFDFKTLELSFTDGQKITIDKEKLLKSDEDIDMDIPSYLLNDLSRSLDDIVDMQIKIPVSVKLHLDRFCFDC